MRVLILATIAGLILSAVLPAGPPALGASGPRLVTFGDSITAGYRVTPPDAVWPVRVAGALGVPLVNAAVGGSKARGQLEAIRLADVRAGDVAVWLAGYNDMRDAIDPGLFRWYLEAGVGSLQARGTTVVLASGLRMTPAGYAVGAPKSNRGSDAAAAAYAAIVADVAAAAGVPYVDLMPVDPANVLADLVHLDGTAHAEIAARLSAGVPAVAAMWAGSTTVAVTWRGPGWLIAPCGALDYVLDGPALGDAVRTVTLRGGDVCEAPVPGMVLAVTDDGYRRRASATVPARPPTPRAIWELALPLVVLQAGSDVPH